MEKISLLVDTDILIDYFNAGLFSNILEDESFIIYYSVVSEKELLSKKGLKDSEKEAIILTLKRCRKIHLDQAITLKYSDLRKLYQSIDKEDALIAATAIVKKLPLMTRNHKHYRKIKELVLIKGTSRSRP